MNKMSKKGILGVFTIFSLLAVLIIGLIAASFAQAQTIQITQIDRQLKPVTGLMPVNGEKFSLVLGETNSIRGTSDTFEINYSEFFEKRGNLGEFKVVLNDEKKEYFLGQNNSVNIDGISLTLVQINEKEANFLVTRFGDARPVADPIRPAPEPQPSNVSYFLPFEKFRLGVDQKGILYDKEGKFAVFEFEIENSSQISLEEYSTKQRTMLSVGERMKLDKGYYLELVEVNREYAVFYSGGNTDVSVQKRLVPTPVSNRFSIPLNAGWNLVSLPANMMPELAIYNPDNCRNNLSFVEFNNETKQFESAKKIVSGNSYWVYNKNTNKRNPNCELVLQTNFDATVFDQQGLFKGWNFIGVTNDMVGKNLSEFSDCKVQAMYSFDSSAKKWVRESMDFGKEDLGKGIAVKTTNSCSLSLDDLPPTPQ